MTTCKEWLFDPLDTLFFREGQPFGEGEGHALESRFPPSPQTMQGVIRSAILLSHCKNIENFRKNGCASCNECSIQGAIGSPRDGDLGNLKLEGPYLSKAGVRYCPAPSDLVLIETSKEIHSLKPAEQPVPSDIGILRYPSAADRGTPLEGWIAQTDLERYLKGDLRGLSVLKAEEFFNKEPRVGIGRDNLTRTVKEGMLYSISPIRFHEDARIEMLVCGNVPDPVGFASKVGGEGRPCRVNIKATSKESAKVGRDTGDACLKLVFLQPAILDSAWLLDGFTPAVKDGYNVWKGTISGVGLTLYSACIRRAEPIGGWNKASKSPRAIRSCVPAGSVYYLEADSVEGAHKLLYTEGGMGGYTSMGFGYYRVGRW